jgi:phage terminase large subunit-like protein
MNVLSPIITDATRAALRVEALRLTSERQLQLYQPYEKQGIFHAAGRSKRERLLMAGNQLGKTWCGGAEVAYHLTGDYPHWWVGRRFPKPTACWASGVTSEATRDTVQRILLGRVGALGTGMIPKAAILDTSQARGIADAVDNVIVQHVSGGRSSLAFKSYEKGREKWQGETLDLVWFDEEPPGEIYNEGLTRTAATGGFVFLTFTPLLGMSDVVRLFYPNPTTPDRHVTQMTIDDSPHISAEQRATIIAGYAPHEREARARGVPMLGSGKIFPIPETAISMGAFAIPPHWPRIGGIDLGGYDHPTAAVKLAWDRDTDVVYVTNTHCRNDMTILLHAASLKPWGDQMPWAWPHDALSHDRQSGETFAELYRRQGLNMLFEKASFEDGGYGLEAGLAMMHERMETGRLKVFDHLGDWFAEFRQYHRKDGRVVKEQDDLLSATRYALMMLRFASLQKGARTGALKRNIKGIA